TGVPSASERLCLARAPHALPPERSAISGVRQVAPRFLLLSSVPRQIMPSSPPRSSSTRWMSRSTARTLHLHLLPKRETHWKRLGSANERGCRAFRFASQLDSVEARDQFLE